MSEAARPFADHPPIGCRISVITVCFNAAATIEKTLQSVSEQRGANVEYIVVDGASTDATLEIVSRYRHCITTLVSEKDKGIFDAMNKGVGLATGDIIYFLNADDEFCDSGVLADVSNAFLTDSRRSFIFGNVVLAGAPAGAYNPLGRAFHSFSITEFLHNSFCHQAVFAKRSLFTAIGTFDLGYKYAADYDWMIRAFLHDRKGFTFINRKIANYFYEGRSRMNADATQREVLSMQFKHLFSFAYAWYLFRYVFLRRTKKFVLNDPY